MKYITTKLISPSTRCARRNQIKKFRYKNSQTREKKDQELRDWSQAHMRVLPLVMVIKNKI